MGVQFVHRHDIEADGDGSRITYTGTAYRMNYVPHWPSWPWPGRVLRISSWIRLFRVPGPRDFQGHSARGRHPHRLGHRAAHRMSTRRRFSPVSRRWHTQSMRLGALVTVIVVIVGIAACTSVSVTASRSDSDAWGGCDRQRAELDGLKESLSPFPLAPSPRLRPFSMIAPCATVRRELDAAHRQLDDQRRSVPGPEDTQIYLAL